MKLVILGAGASYDAFNWYKDENTFKNWRAPLSNQIFDTRDNFLKIIDIYPGSNLLFSEIGSLTDAETFFQKHYDISKKSNAIEIEKKLINMKFFLQHLFSEISKNLTNAGYNNIAKLIGIINEYVIATGEDVLIINFNYDLLVENILSRVYYNYKQTGFEISDYLKNKIKLIKPHGSCNWHRAFPSLPVQNGQLAWQHILSTNTNQKTIDSILNEEFYCLPYDTIQHPVGNQYRYLFPQIHIPLSAKDSFTMPKEQERYLYDYLPRVDEMLIIGWKGNEQHFNSVLKEHLGAKQVRIQVVNGPMNLNPGIVIQNLKGSIDTSKVDIFDRGIEMEWLPYKKEVKEQVYNYVLSGSLSSCLSPL